jgi:hypothetical protein
VWIEYVSIDYRGMVCAGRDSTGEKSVQYRGFMYHRHSLDSPVWTLAFFRSFRQSNRPAVASSVFVTIFFPGWGYQPHAQPPAILEDRCFLSGLSPLAGWPQLVLCIR